MQTQFISILVPVLTLTLGYLFAWWKSQQKLQKSEAIWNQKVQSDYTLKSEYVAMQRRCDEHVESIKELTADIATQKQIVTNLQAQSIKDQEELDERRRIIHEEIQNLSNRIFEEKSEKLTTSQAEKMAQILSPFNEKLGEFKKKVEEIYVNDTKERSALEHGLKQIIQTEHKLMEETIRLTNALSGDSQFQGSWGELQLEVLLQSAGLQEGIHYEKQQGLLHEDNSRVKPDFIIHLPENRHVLLDSKLTLNAFERYQNAESDEERTASVKALVNSISAHVKGLGSKSYPRVKHITTPDYVLMFVPLEPALMLALHADPELHQKALSKNVAIVSGSSLLVALRMIAMLWKNDNQTRNVLEIARQGGALYDKFVGFLEDLQRLGTRLSGAQQEYESALNKLSESARKGDTIIGRCEKLKELGAEATKQIPPQFLLPENVGAN